MPSGRIDDELKLTLTMDSDGYIRKANGVNRANIAIANSMDQAQHKARGISSVFQGLGASLALAGVGAVAVAGAIFEVDKAMIGAAFSASKKAADFESLTLALAAVDGGAAKAKVSLEELRNIAKGPGLGVEEAIGTYSGLRRGGIDKDLAMGLTRELGNAVATAGGGRDMLGRAGLALGQMATKPFIQGEELNQLTEAGIPAHKIIRDLFGTSDGAELKKLGVTSTQVLSALSVELAKMPRVAGGAKNAFENLDESWTQVQVKIGDGINTILTPMVNGLATELDKLTTTDELKKFGAEFATIWKDIFNDLTGGVGGVKGAIEGLTDAALYLSYLSKNIINKATGGISGASDIASFIYGQKGFTERMMMAAATMGMSELGRPVFGAFEGASDQLADNKRKRGLMTAGMGADAGSMFTTTPDEPPKKDDPNQPTRLLKEIADNTKPLRDIRDVMLGGGAFSPNAFNPVNMGAWTGSQGQNQIHKGFQMIMSGLASSVNGQFVDLARQRHLDPGAL